MGWRIHRSSPVNRVSTERQSDDGYRTVTATTTAKTGAAATVHRLQTGRPLALTHVFEIAAPRASNCLEEKGIGRAARLVLSGILRHLSPRGVGAPFFTGERVYLPVTPRRNSPNGVPAAFD